MSLVRPGVGNWLRYSVGGRLPDVYLEWMFTDATTRRWRLRQTVRALVPAVAVFAALAVVLAVFTPAPWPVVLVVLGTALVASAYFAAGMAEEGVEVRLVHHGFAPDAARERRAFLARKGNRRG